MIELLDLREAHIHDRAPCPAQFGDHVGQESNVALICEIRDRAAAILRQAGFVLIREGDDTYNLRPDLRPEPDALLQQYLGA